MAVNKVVQSNGTTLIDISDTTAIAADVASGKYFYLATGEKVAGNATADRNTYITSWTQGTISYSNGTDGGSATRCKTDEYISASTMSSGNFVGLTVATGYKIGIREYASEDASSFVTAYTFRDGSYFGTGITTAPITQGHYYKFIVGKSDNSNLAPKNVPSNVLGFFDIPIETAEKTITINGTYNALDDLVDGYSSVTVNVPSSAASSWTKVAETTYQVSTTSTNTATVATWATGHSEIWTSDKIVYVRIRDTAGKRAGYFYGVDAWVINRYPKSPSLSTYTSCSDLVYQIWPVNEEGEYKYKQGYNTTGYGVYPDTIYKNGDIRIRSRYSNSGSSTINGTYKVEVYLLDPPTGAPIFE